MKKIFTIKKSLKNSNSENLFELLLDCIDCKSDNDYEKLPEIAKMIVALDAFNIEVQNGGFHQFLSNSSGDLSEDVKKFLKEIASTVAYKIILDISSKFPNSEIPRDRSTRNNFLFELEDKDTNFNFFQDFDMEYYESDENIMELLQINLIERENELYNYLNAIS